MVNYIDLLRIVWVVLDGFVVTEQDFLNLLALSLSFLSKLGWG